MAKHLKSRPLFAQNAPVKKRSLFDAQFSFLPAVWGWVKRIAMGLGFLALFQFVVLLFLLPVIMKGPIAPPLPSAVVLYLDLDEPLSDVPAQASFADPFAPVSMTLREHVNVIRAAADDARVQGMVVRLRNAPISLTQSYELHQALDAFKDAGKFAHIYSTSYGEGVGGMGRYYFASAFDQIWMMPLGIVSVAGLNAELPYFREGLGKLGVEPQFFQRNEYKTAYESVTNREMSAQNREMMERLLDDLRVELSEGIAAHRGVAVSQFEALVDVGLLTAQEALDGGLITHADYVDVLIEDIKEATTGDRSASDELFVTFGQYAAQMDAVKSQEKIALIHAVGAIMPRADGGAPLGASGVAAADEIAPAILAAADDEDVAAIVLRIDSPGGSPTASESILRAIEKAKEKDKRIVVSMGAAAASGGYWIAAYADEIFVMPSTITGSIGVVGGKFSLAALWDKMGVNWERLGWGENAAVMSFNTPFSKGEAARFNVMLDAIYEAFIARVSKGRDMAPEAVEAIAGGRVWTGVRAVENGLADQIGGLQDALEFAAVESGFEGVDEVEVIVLPKPKSPFEELVMLLEGQVSLGRFMRENTHIFEAFSSVSRGAWEAQHADVLSVYDPPFITQ